MLKGADECNTLTIPGTSRSETKGTSWGVLKVGLGVFKCRSTYIVAWPRAVFAGPSTSAVTADLA